MCNTISKALARLASLGSGALPNEPVTIRGWGRDEEIDVRVDIHHHLVPPGYANLLVRPGQEKSPYFAEVMSWTPQRAIERMDSVGIDTAMTSVVGAGGWPEGPTLFPQFMRESNEFAARVALDYPGRFGVFAGVPLPFVDASLVEIGYALDKLSADGLCVYTSYAGIRLGDPRFDPVMEELNRRSAVVFIHPVGSPDLEKLVPGLAVGFTELVFETARTIASLLFNGAFARFPKIRFIFPHGGGALPVLTERWNLLGKSDERYAAYMPNGVAAELARHHYDLATIATPKMYEAVRAFAPIDRLLLGTDYPLLDIGSTGRGLGGIALSDDETNAINHRNAERLFPRLVAPSSNRM